MNSSKRFHPTAVIVFFIILSLPFSSINATEYYAFRLIGSDCTFCHNDPQTGSLNQTGRIFQEGGYRYPFTWKGVFFYFLGGLTLFSIILGIYRRYWLWRIGRDDWGKGRWKERWNAFFKALSSFFLSSQHLLQKS